MIYIPAIAHGAEIENNGKKLLDSCQVALEVLDTDAVTADLKAVQFCDDYLTGFREDENIKEITMGGHYLRGYCFPYTGITNGDLARVIVKYLQANEYEQVLAANIAIRDALIEGYPCTD